MKTFPRHSLAALAFGLTLPAVALAQERPNTILVLDASGSMWGQIDGVNKITIAREVVANILSDFPADQHLGFVTYGHRERGSCTDIQTVIAPAPGTAPEIIKIVNELNPRGMTPMTDAVIAAAQAMRHTEQAATVILVSDGIETCNPDPCAAARALAEAGVDFTTHVIGFDVRGEAEALMQMQCIADETGGRFFTADNAEELTAALQQVVAASDSASFTFTAYQNPARMGPEPVFFFPESTVSAGLAAGAVSWEISDNEYSFVETGTGNPFTLDLPFGDYVVTVTADAWDQPVQTEESFTQGSIRNLAVMFPAAAPPLAELSLRAVMDSTDGPLIETPITWSFEMDGESFEFDGNPGQIELREGSWTITAYHIAGEVEQSAQFALAGGAQRTETFIFETPAPQVMLIAPDSAPAATTLVVGYRGDNLHEHNIISLHNIETGQRFTETRNRGNDEVSLLMPATPGAYELRYYFGRDIAARKPLEVTPVDIHLIAPTTVAAGAEFEVTWAGLPQANYDLVRLRSIDPRRTQSESYTRNRDSVRLRAPEQPGAYEIIYLQGNLSNIVARLAVTVTAAE
ncbi:vWA domain-containing protein [Haematobacter missouriensis]|uniref:VWFA domain-containing protein n=1 Tax=Haematobacter missouriensis TaxID=366616 RepID=A0ABX3ZXT0_9RHOB|nr:VWA domain-containing protein [Haematobacter missouriensis]OWJ79759.1 hypothetical protein CDV53_00905 [Haematobacter missouriensis]